MDLKRSKYWLKYLLIIAVSVLFVSANAQEYETDGDTIYDNTGDSEYDEYEDDEIDDAELVEEYTYNEDGIKDDSKKQDIKLESQKEIFENTEKQSLQDFKQNPLPSKLKIKKIPSKYNSFKEKPKETIKEFKQKKRGFGELNSIPSGWVYALAIIMAMALVGFLIYTWGGVKNSKIDKIKSSIYDLTNEADIETIKKSELELALENALKIKDYRLAIRIHYLMLIKDLSEKHLIKWKKQKTNFDYFMELNEKSFSQPFMDLTLAYEKVWYGKFAVNKGIYGGVSQQFKQFKTHE